MASTSVHLPPAVVEQLDKVAAERGTSRNRVILQACEQLLADRRGTWSNGYFELELSADDLAELRSGGHEMEAAIRTSRRDRGTPAL